MDEREKCAKSEITYYVHIVAGLRRTDRISEFWEVKMKKWFNILVKLVCINVSLILILFGCKGEKMEDKKPVQLTVVKRLIGIPSTPSMKHLKPNRNRNVVIYLVPHADDEVLTFGVPIRNDLQQKKEVYVLLLSKGELSQARDVVNGYYDHESNHPYMAGKVQWCKLHQRLHIPSAEGYAPLSVEAFGQARVKEFIRATADLGVPKQNTFVYELQHGHFGNTPLIFIIKDWLKLFPNATFVSMSEIDVQRDHAQVGKVLNRLHQQNIVKFKRNYASVATRMKFHYLKSKYPSFPLISKKDHAHIIKAIDVYRIWEPHKGHFALGYHSVETQFEFSKRHMDSILLPK